MCPCLFLHLWHIVGMHGKVLPLVEDNGYSICTYDSSFKVTVTFMQTTLSGAVGSLFCRNSSFLGCPTV